VTSNSVVGDGGTVGRFAPYWFTPDDDNPGCDGGEADAVVRLTGGELLFAPVAAVRGMVRPPIGGPAPHDPNLNADGPARVGAARLWFHLDEVYPLIAHAAGCLRHRITGAQAAAKARTVPALVWRGTDTTDELYSNGWPSWHDADGTEVTATAYTWVHRPTGRRAVAGTEGGGAFFPLASPPGAHRLTPHWSVQAADPLMHWLAVEASSESLLADRPRITIHESRGDLYPPDAVWQPATVACVPTVGPGRYPALIAAEYANTLGGQLARFTRTTIDAMIHDLEILDWADRSMPGEHAALQWRGTDLYVCEVIDTVGHTVHRRVDVIRPDADGLYPLGAHTWPWLTVPADPGPPAASDGDSATTTGTEVA
jgi:hypothetical protein